MRQAPIPRGVGPLAGVAVAFLALPLVALAVRVPWSRLATLAGDAEVLAAVRISLLASLAAVALAAVLGLPLAWLLARRSFPGRDLVRALAVLPMVLPPVVAGVALLLAFGRRGAIGGALFELTGLTLPFSLSAVVLAEAFVAMPFVVVTVEAGLRSLDPDYELAAATLGASRWTVLRRVTAPLVAPSVGAGLVLAWARALGEFGATITFAGALSGRTETMPVAVYRLLQTDAEAAYLLSAVLLALSVAVLVSMRGRFLDRR